MIVIILFRCESVYQLLNAINIKVSILGGETADVMLTDSTDFSAFLPMLSQIGVFRRIFCSPDNITKNRAFRNMTPGEQKRLIRHPEKYIYDIGCTDKYSDMYIPSVNNVYTDLLYYSMVKEGRKPRLHIFEDGITSYLHRMQGMLDADILDHHWVKASDRMENNIEDIFLYKPELFEKSTDRINNKINVHCIPVIDEHRGDVREVLFKVFGHAAMPEEKYIFLEEGFVKDRRLVADIRYLDYIANIVGKENIIVKMHPRNDIDRFTPRGYKTVKNSIVPWEITLLDADLSDKVFLTISSTSAVSAPVVTGKPCFSVMLFKLTTINKPLLTQYGSFGSYFNNLYREMNKDGKHMFCPQSVAEINEILRFLQGSEKK